MININKKELLSNDFFFKKENIELMHRSTHKQLIKFLNEINKSLKEEVDLLSNILKYIDEKVIKNN
ncbi:MAG: hypothetical protein AB8U93_03555 [Francisella endosymbiont of Hyalomma scupense]